jgi:hypothetical protein
MDSGRVSDIRFYGQPEGTIYPLDMLPADKQKLPGFIWDENNKPRSNEFNAPFSVPELPKRRAENTNKTPTAKIKKK